MGKEEILSQFKEDVLCPKCGQPAGIEEIATEKIGPNAIKIIEEIFCFYCAESTMITRELCYPTSRIDVNQ